METLPRDLSATGTQLALYVAGGAAAAVVLALALWGVAGIIDSFDLVSRESFDISHDEIDGPFETRRPR